MVSCFPLIWIGDGFGDILLTLTQDMLKLNMLLATLPKWGLAVDEIRLKRMSGT